MKDFSLSLADVLVDKETEGDTTRIFYTKNIELAATAGITVTTNTYALTTGHLQISTAEETHLQQVVLRVKPELEQQTPLDDFREMRTYLRLDSITVQNAYISYKEFAEKGHAPGMVFFDQITASLTNLTNDSILVSLENPAVLRGKALLMGEGKTDITLKVPIFNDSTSFHYTASLGR